MYVLLNNSATKIFLPGKLRYYRRSCEQKPSFSSLKKRMDIKVLKKKISARRICHLGNVKPLPSYAILSQFICLQNCERKKGAHSKNVSFL